MASHDQQWYMDTGATSHLSSYTGNLQTSSLNRNFYSVIVGNGSFIPVTHSGHVQIPNPYRPLHFRNVLAHPISLKTLFQYENSPPIINVPLILIHMVSLYEIIIPVKPFFIVTTRVIYTLYTLPPQPSPYLPITIHFGINVLVTLVTLHTDHNLWDVIVNGDLEEEPTPTGETSAPPAPKTAKQLAAKRNQERVKSILLLVIPDEYLLKFHNVPDAKSL
ncbi:hypothetical protein Tco_0330773 [Tanacetum coccineum]